MDINQKLTEELNVKRWQVDAAVKLIDEGNTIPFIARYRKEATGTLDDEQLRKLHERLTYLRNLEEKKEQVLGSITEQGKLTEESTINLIHKCMKCCWVVGLGSSLLWVTIQNRSTDFYHDPFLLAQYITEYVIDFGIRNFPSGSRNI